MSRREVSAREARAIAKRFGVRMPRMGYEVSLGDGRWLGSTGHHQFGWFERSAQKPFEVRCRCDEELRRFEPRGCTADCPAREVK